MLYIIGRSFVSFIVKLMSRGTQSWCFVIKVWCNGLKVVLPQFLRNSPQLSRNSPAYRPHVARYDRWASCSFIASSMRSTET